MATPATLRQAFVGDKANASAFGIAPGTPGKLEPNASGGGRVPIDGAG